MGPLIPEKPTKSLLIKKLVEWLFYAVAFTIPLLSEHLNSKIIILLALFSLLSTNLLDLWRRIKNYKIYWLFSSLFLLDVIGLIPSDNLQEGLGYLETKASVIVFPLVILAAAGSLTIQIIRNICKAFALGVLAVLVGYLIILLSVGLETGFDFESWFQDRLSIIPAIANARINIHPSYLSLYVAFSTFCVFEELRLTHEKRVQLLYGTVLLVFLAFQLWLNSRAGLIGFVLVGIFYFANRSNKKQKLIAGVGAIIFITILSVLPFTQERFILAPLRAIQDVGQVNATDEDSWPIALRIQIYDCSIQILKNNYWLWGYGTGDFKDKINECYREMNYGWLVARKLDSHNEYFAQLHRHGIAGMALFLMCLIIPFRKAMHGDDIVCAVFILLIGLSCLPENLLSSQKGVVFYALFNSLLCLRVTMDRSDHEALSPGQTYSPKT